MLPKNSFISCSLCFKRLCLYIFNFNCKEWGVSVVEKSINHTPAAAVAIPGAREKIAGKGFKESTLDAAYLSADFDN